MSRMESEYFSAFNTEERQMLSDEEGSIRWPSSNNQDSPSKQIACSSKDFPSKQICVALSSSSSMCSSKSQGYHGNEYHPAEVSCGFQISVHQAGASAETSSLRHHENHAESDCKSWVEVRKQRVVIVIPPVPESRRNRSIAKLPSRKGVANQYASIQIMGVIHKRRSVKEKVYNKTKKVRMCINGSEGWETGEAISWNAREKTRKDAPPVSDSCGDKASSLDAADSSHEPNHSNRGRDSRIHCAMKHRDKSDHSIEGRNHMAEDPDAQLNDAPIGPVCTGSGSTPGDKRAGFFNVSEGIRVINLEKHLKNAGGLKRWLYSLGLEQFMDVFDKGRWGATELLELRMDDLKRMGKAAVGPRRKLIWAIHRFSQQIV
ncbi:hypothetical protein KP509_21G089100 [Ceratopteris richardii]|uniref:SAM domain-containing protein n=1 Tax=Ceratopteris richardii TaxID=49495 RepID=A0A8T2SE56_CERRI|nr:hypothetical protein KP509_21G089100 [Ceratopteris richardii]